MARTRILIAGALLLVAIFVPAEVSVGLGGDVVITFSYDAPDADLVTIAGSFQGWNETATPMTRGDDGVWTYELVVPPDTVLQYKFLVDGTWTEDPDAPATTDDGYGGLNGLVNVPALLAGDDSGGGGGSIIASGNTRFYSSTTFLTRDIATGETSGFEIDQSGLYGVAYWTLSGQVAPGFRLFTELQLFNGGTTIFQANTDGSQAALTSIPDGLDALAQGLWRPFGALNGGGRPSLNKFQFTFEAPLFSLATGYGAAQATTNSLIYTTISGADAGDGFLEIKNRGDLTALPGDLGWWNGMVALTRRAGGLGIASYQNFDILDGTFVTVGYNANSPATALADFWTDSGHSVSLGVRTAINAMTVRAHLLGAFGPNDAFGAATLAAAADLDVSADGRTLYVLARWAGENPYTVFGDDGTVGKGTFYLQVSPSLQNDLFKVGVDTNVTLDNFIADDDGSGFADEDGDGDTDAVYDLYVKPYYDLYLSQIVPSLNATATVYAKTGVRTFNETFDIQTRTVIRLNELGVQGSFSDLAAFMPSLTVSYAGLFGYATYNVFEPGTVLETLTNSILVQAGLANDVQVNGGVILRSNFDESLTAAERAQLVPFGFAVGAGKRFAEEFLGGPYGYANFAFNFDPFDGGQVGLAMNDFAPSNRDGSTGVAYLRVGMSWDL